MLLNHPLYLSPSILAFLAYTLNPKKIQARSEPLDPIQTRASGGTRPCFHFVYRLIGNNNNNNNPCKDMFFHPFSYFLPLSENVFFLPIQRIKPLKNLNKPFFWGKNYFQKGWWMIFKKGCEWFFKKIYTPEVLIPPVVQKED